MAEAKKIKQFIKDKYYGSFIDMSYNEQEDIYVIMYSLNSQLMMLNMSSDKYKEITDKEIKEYLTLDVK